MLKNKDLKISIITVAWSYAVSRIIVALSIGFYWQNIKHKSVGNNFMFKTPLNVFILEINLTHESNLRENSHIIPNNGPEKYKFHLNHI